MTRGEFKRRARRWASQRQLRHSPVRDAGQAMIAFVVGITLIISTGAAVLATVDIQHDPLVQRNALEHYTYRAVEAGANSYLSTVNADPNEMNCNYSSIDLGECPASKYKKWIPVTGTTGGNGIVPEYFYWTDPKFCYTETCKTTANTEGSLLYVKEVIYGAAGFPGRTFFGDIIGNFESENGFLTHIWWSDFEATDPLINTHPTSACTWNWNNTFDGPDVPQPVITGLSPSSGSVAGGTTITISGRGFVGTAKVSFGGVAGTTVYVVSRSEITVKAPAHAAGYVDVVVTTANGSSTTGHKYDYTSSAPTVSKVTPGAGKTTGGTLVTITGTGFLAGSTVSFGSVAATTVTVVSGVEITARAPAHAAGTVTVVVHNADGSGDGHYTYDAAPTLTGVSPTAGKATGTATITLTGTAFVTGATTVSFGGTAGTVTKVTSTTSMKVKAPAHAAGSVTVTVTTPGGTSNPDVYTYDAVPTLTKVTPSASATGGGTTVVLTGTNFATGASVKFGSTSASTVRVTVPTKITVKVPSHSGKGSVTVTVTTPGGTSNGVAFYYGDPSLTQVSPAAGKTTGGTTATLTGTGFVTGATVSFGGTAATVVSVTSPTAMKVATPAHVTGSVSVTVTTSAGTSSGVAFYYGAPTLTTVTPSAGKVTGGTTVTLTGTGFVTGATVSFGGTTGTVASVTSPTTMKVKAPAHAAGSVTVTVTTAGGTSSPKTYTYVSAPTLTSVSPTAGKTTGGTTVTLTGTNLTGATKVTFGSAGATTFTVTSPTTITATVPTHTAGTVTVTVTTSGGTSGSGVHFTYDAVPTLTKVTPAAGKTTGGTTVTLTGTGFVTGATVSFGGTTGTVASVTSPTTMKVTTPRHTAIGSSTVKVTTPGGTSGGVAFYYGAPTLSSVTPSTGGTSGGTTDTLTGTGFVTGAIVTFGSSLATTVRVRTNGTKITLRTPSRTSGGTITVTVTTAGGTSNSKKYTYVLSPILTSVTPAGGRTAGGTSVTVRGTNLTGTTSVTFGSTSATRFTVVSTTSIIATIPSHGYGYVTVTVTTPGGTSNGVSFHYTKNGVTSYYSGIGNSRTSNRNHPKYMELDSDIKTLEQPSSATLLSTTGNACTPVVFASDTQVYGPIYSNDSIYVETSSTPSHLGPIETEDPDCIAVYGFDYTFTPPDKGTCMSNVTSVTGSKDEDGHAKETVPTSDSELSTYAAQDNASSYGCLYYGPTTVEFDTEDRMTVWSPDTTGTTKCPSTGNTEPVPNGEHTTVGNGVIYVETETTPADCKANANPFEDKTTSTTTGKQSQIGKYYRKGTTTPNCEADVFVSDHPVTTSRSETLGKPTTIPGISGDTTVGSSANIVITGTLEYTHCGSSFKSTEAHTGYTATNKDYPHLCPFHRAGTKTPTHSTRTEPNDVLGLIANDYIEVNHPVTTTGSHPITTCTTALRGTPKAAVCEPGPVTIDAAILALEHSFAVNNYSTCKHGTGTGQIGTLTVYGTINQMWRGAVGEIGECNGGFGRSTTSGYVKYYDWDSRVTAVTPPHYLNPSTPSWALISSAISGAATPPLCTPPVATPATPAKQARTATPAAYPSDCATARAH